MGAINSFNTLLHVIPREGVESSKAAAIRIAPLDAQVIPREGVERTEPLIHSSSSRVTSDPERGS